MTEHDIGSIVIVEDDILQQRLLKRQCARYPFSEERIYTASNGREGLTKLTELFQLPNQDSSAPYIVFTDRDMSYAGEGYEFLCSVLTLVNILTQENPTRYETLLSHIHVGATGASFTSEEIRSLRLKGLQIERMTKPVEPTLVNRLIFRARDTFKASTSQL